MVVALRRVQETLPSSATTFEAVRVTAATPELESTIASMRSPAPDGLSLSIAQVAPDRHIQWQNDYGDGVFELTLRNDGVAAVAVPALIEVNGAVQWQGAVEVRDESGRHLGITRGLAAAGAKPVRLAPGASIRTRVDVKPFGIVNPPGGSRVAYSFGVAELRASSFFYYSHSLHGLQMGAGASGPAASP